MTPPPAAPPPWARHLRPTLADVDVYDVAPTIADVRLHANECAQPWPAHVTETLCDVLRSVELGRYPDTSGRELRAIIAGRHGCAPEQVVLGNGSDEVIALLLTALGGDGRQAPTLVVPTPTFVMYGHTARVLGYAVTEVPLDDAFQLDASSMRGALGGASVCFLARPNNPTASLWDAGLIAELIAGYPDVVFVIDEAYAAYAPGATMWRPDLPDNHVHMATLSKVGLAALRLGYCIAHPDLAAALNKVRHPYNISATSLALASTVLTRFADVQAEMIAESLRQRLALLGVLRQLPGAQVYPSSGNFVLVQLASEDEPARLCQFLATRGIVIKDASATPGLARCIRVGVGTAEEVRRLATAIAQWSNPA